ncbi:MAG: TfoX/Sxy family protein [Bacteroidetes bacterium]|nr:TfoX/Sxy family protein [Bacteroidota bacterium]
MAFDEYLGERITRIFKEKKIVVEEKKMMGGLCYLLNDKMCVGVVKNELMVRFDPDLQEEVLKRNGARIMDFTKKPMQGYVFVSPEGVDMDDDLQSWIELAIEFNPKAKASKKKKK